jgi:hypothetical protein
MEKLVITIDDSKLVPYYILILITFGFLMITKFYGLW